MTTKEKNTNTIEATNTSTNDRMTSRSSKSVERYPEGNPMNSANYSKNEIDLKLKNLEQKLDFNFEKMQFLLANGLSGIQESLDKGISGIDRKNAVLTKEISVIKWFIGMLIIPAILSLFSKFTITPH